MTLILTWLFPFGIFMGADSAVTFTSQFVTDASGERKPLILTGGKKVFPIPKIRAGISFWGDANVGDSTTFEWISNFIYSHRSQYNNIHDFAALLQDELRNVVPELSDPESSLYYRYGRRGFHVAGFTDYKGQMVPTFYHVHNGLSETNPKINPRIINANHDFPPEKVSQLFSEGKVPYVRNGEFIMYLLLFDNLYKSFKQFESVLREEFRPFTFPDTTKFSNRLEAYTEFIRFWIKLVRDVYALSNVPEIIGGDVMVLSIPKAGEMGFSRKP
jgi:hypothetical protein